jgi:hypothetical protein
MIKGSPLIAKRVTIREKYSMIKKLGLVFVILIILLTGCSQKKVDGPNILLRIITKGVTGGIDLR